MVNFFLVLNDFNFFYKILIGFNQVSNRLQLQCSTNTRLTPDCVYENIWCLQYFHIFQQDSITFWKSEGWQTFLRFTFFTYRLNLVLSYRILSTTRFYIILTPLICDNWFHPYVILIKDACVISCSSFCLSFHWTLLHFEKKNSCLKSSVTKWVSSGVSIYFLTHSFPMHPFSTSWKNQKIVRFSDVFRG